MIQKSQNQTQFTINLDGPDGNVFNLIGTAKGIARELRKADIIIHIDTVVSEMMSGDYTNAVKTFNDYFGEYVTLETEDEELIQAVAGGFGLKGEQPDFVTISKLNKAKSGSEEYINNLLQPKVEVYGLVYVDGVEVDLEGELTQEVISQIINSKEVNWTHTDKYTLETTDEKAFTEGDCDILVKVDGEVKVGVVLPQHLKDFLTKQYNNYKNSNIMQTADNNGSTATDNTVENTQTEAVVENTTSATETTTEETAPTNIFKKLSRDGKINLVKPLYEADTTQKVPAIHKQVTDQGWVASYDEVWYIVSLIKKPVVEEKVVETPASTDEEVKE